MAQKQENDITTKPVAFNRASEEDQELLKHIEHKTNFSAYIKRLIFKDILERRWERRGDK